MKYMLLLYDNANTRELFSSPEGAEKMARVNAVMDELTASGELIGGEALAEPPNTRTVGLDGVVTDGPLAEAKEFFGGYLMVDVESFERAVEIAQMWPSAPIEVRPLMSGGGEEL
jgi:hypothetical protein